MNQINEDANSIVDCPVCNDKKHGLLIIHVINRTTSDFNNLRFVEIQSICSKGHLILESRSGHLAGSFWSTKYGVSPTPFPTSVDGIRAVTSLLNAVNKYLGKEKYVPYECGISKYNSLGGLLTGLLLCFGVFYKGDETSLHNFIDYFTGKAQRTPIDASCLINIAVEIRNKYFKETI